MVTAISVTASHTQAREGVEPGLFVTHTRTVDPSRSAFSEGSLQALCVQLQSPFSLCRMLSHVGLGEGHHFCSCCCQCSAFFQVTAGLIRQVR